MPEFSVEKNLPGARLDQFLVEKLPHLSRSRIQGLIKTGFALVNGAHAKTGAKLKKGDLICVCEPPPPSATNQPEDIPLDVLFEDDDLLVINKPPGLVVHPAPGHAAHTLVNALLHHCRTLSGLGGAPRPGIVHRLDKDTSGCLVVAKNDRAHLALSRQFAARTVTKIYLALAAGSFQTKSHLVEEAIARHPVQRQKMATTGRGGRAAKTTFNVLQSLPFGSLVACTLHTGRTHQIRVHLQHLGHPVLGDKLYGGRLAGPFPRQMLHAWQLGFAHPRTGARVIFRAPLPDDFIKAGVRLPNDE